MNPQFIEVIVTTDTADTLVAPRKALIRVDQITSVVDISSGGYRDRTSTELHLEEEADYINDDAENGGVVRGRRSVCVQENFETVKRLMDSAARTQTE